MSRHLRKIVRGAGPRCGTRVLAALCCLLLLAPVLSVRAVVAVQRWNVQESEESRPASEEERSSEDPIDPRSSSRRYLENLTSGPARPGIRGASSCRLAGRPVASFERAEHELRNGIGGPLRC
jgi:hypothetical protein